jgi:hypothetical protein
MEAIAMSDWSADPDLGDDETAFGGSGVCPECGGDGEVVCEACGDWDDASVCTECHGSGLAPCWECS